MSGYRSLFFASVVSASLFVASATAKVFVLPHVLETSGRITTTQNTFDTQFFMTYTGVQDTGATVDLYVYDGATGAPLKSATNADVCNPCTQTLGARGPRQSVSLEGSIVAKGGFPGGAGGPVTVDAFAVAVVTGDTDNVDFTGELEYAKSGPLDLSLTQLRYHKWQWTPASSSTKRVFVLPHVLEMSGKTSAQGSTFDTDLFATYVGGIGTVTGSGGATVDLYLFDNTGMPMKSATPADVCNPCTYDLTTGARKASINVDDLIVAKGGFGGAYKTGYGIIVVGGADPENVAVQGFVVNSHSSAMDLSVFGFDPVPITAAKTLWKEFFHAGVAKAFSGVPNPTAAGADFSVEMTQASRVTLEIYNVAGRKMVTAFNGGLGIGSHQIRWNGNDAGGARLAPGNYFARLSGDDGSRITRFIVVR